MVYCHRTLLATFLWTVLLLAGTTSRLPAQEQTLGSESEGDQSQATPAEVVSLPGITGKATPTAELQAPDLEQLLSHLEAFRKAHTPFHIRHREVIKLRNASEVKALESMNLPPGMLLDTEYESAFWDNRSWKRCLSRGVDGEPASDKRSSGDCEGTAELDVPFALLGVFIEPKPENCKLTFDDIFPHITITADEHKGQTELWMFPVSGHWIPKRLRGTPEDKEEPVIEWEVNHIKAFGKDRPPQIIDGEVRFTVRNGEQESTITSEFFITKALYGDDVVPGEIDASLTPVPDPPVAATEQAPDNAARGDKSITDPSGDQSTGHPMPLAVRILDGREDREFLGHLEPLKAGGIIEICDDPTATGDIILTIDGPPLTDSKQFQDLLRGISQLRLPSCLVNVKPQPRTDPRQDSVVQISTRPEVSFAEVARVVDSVKNKPRIAFLLRQSEAAFPLGREPVVLESSVPVQRAHGETFSFSIGVSGQSIDGLRQQSDALEKRARSLSDQLRKPLPDPATGETLKSQLRDTVRQAFENRQNLQRAELAKFAQRLKGIQESIESRDKVSEQIIDRRVEELLDPNLKWDEPGTDSGRARALRSDLPPSSSEKTTPDGSRRAAILMTPQIQLDVSPRTPIQDEKAISKLVLTFFQDRSRRAVPCVVLKINEEYFAVTTSPATVVPDGTPHAIDRSVVEWNDGSRVSVTYDERSTKELQLYRFADGPVIPESMRSAVEIMINAIPAVGADKSLEIGVALSALTPVGAGSLSETRVHLSAINVSQKLTLPSHKVEHHYEGLFAVDVALPEGTPVFLDGKLMGLTLLGSRFVGEEATQSYVFPANRLWELCNKVP